MNRVLDVDRESGLVRVQAGIGLRELNLALDAHGLAVENLGDIDVQSLAGATATGTHGTGSRLRTSPRGSSRCNSYSPTGGWRSSPSTTTPTPGARPG